MDLPSGSKTLTVNFGKKKMRQLTIEDMIRLKNSENFSSEQTLGVANAVRAAFMDRNSVEPGLQEALPNLKLNVKEFFTVKVIIMTEKGEIEESFTTHPLFFCEDLEAFIQYVIQKRGLDPNNLEIICGIDDGQKMLKVISFCF